MTKLKGIVFVVSQLREQRTTLANELNHVDEVLSVLGKLNRGKTLPGPRRTLSLTARRKIAAAQRLRWAKVRAQNVVPMATSSASRQRKMSASARRKIAAAQRARWAKVKRAA
jgi:hypothetical protein